MCIYTEVYECLSYDTLITVRHYCFNHCQFERSSVPFGFPLFGLARSSYLLVSYYNVNVFLTDL